MAKSFVPPQDRKFAVAELEFNGGIYAVPVATSWLKNISHTLDGDGRSKLVATIAWPKDEDRLTELIIKNHKPDPASGIWDFKEGTILKFCTTLRSAKDGVDGAAETSDLDTDGPILNKKRTRKPNLRFGEHESDSDEDEGIKRRRTSGSSKARHVHSDDEHDVSPVTRAGQAGPPKLTLLNIERKLAQSGKASGDSSTTSTASSQISATIDKSTGGKRAASPDLGVEELNSDDDNQEINKSVTSSPVLDRQNDTAEKVRTSSFLDRRSGSVKSIKTGLPASRLSFSPNKSKLKAYSVGLPSRSPAKTNAGFLAGGTLKLSKDMDFVKDVLGELSFKMNAVYLSVCPHALDDETEVSQGLGIPPLPLKSKSDIDEFERFIENENHHTCVVNLLADHGGNNLKETIYNIMRKVMTNELASGFNMEGLNRNVDDQKTRKSAFKNTPLHKIVLAAAKRRETKLMKKNIALQYDVKFCNSYLSTWLKDAPKRHTNESKKAERLASRDEDKDSSESEREQEEPKD